MSDETEIFVVERHDDQHYGPNNVRYARSAIMALDLAQHEMSEHDGEGWDTMRTSDHSNSVTFSPRDSRGWVRIRRDVLHE